MVQDCFRRGGAIHQRRGHVVQVLLAQDGLAWRGRRAFEGGDAQAGAPRRRADGEVAEVLDVKKHEGIFTVSKSHRVAVPSSAGTRDLRADFLTLDRSVIIGNKERKLTKVEIKKASTDLYEVVFEADGPVEMFHVRKWGLVTYGAASSGPVAAEDLPCGSSSSESTAPGALALGAGAFLRRTPVAEILSSTGLSGYGEIVRLHLASEDAELEQIIAKEININVSEADMNETRLAEHRRFVKGFRVEAAAYRNLSAELQSAGLAAPRLLHLDEGSQGAFTIFLTDISHSFPRGAEGVPWRMNVEETKAALRWLAGFHALYWERGFAEERGLWRRGSYWILDRLGELQLSAAPPAIRRYLPAEDAANLRRLAPALDARLAGCDPTDDSRCDGRFRTLVHGDAKPGNLLCTRGRDGYRCAALDFGWVGEGYGMYDVAYLLWDQMATNVVQDLLDFYHAFLGELLPADAAAAYDKDVARDHFELCVVDFMRWQLGFQGGRHFWAMPWAMDIFRRTLARLGSGDAGEAVAREFPLRKETGGSQAPGHSHGPREKRRPVETEGLRGAPVQDAVAQTDTFELGTPRAAVLRGAAASGACSRQEEEEAIDKLREAVRQLQDARHRQTKAKAGEQRALEEIQKRDALIAQLREELV
ncbi:unnamed protein product [Effrenium voratum]|nr:unnamed protein product [Effrenium voratum]